MGLNWGLGFRTQGFGLVGVSGVGFRVQGKIDLGIT